METTTKTPRITKSMKFEAITAMLKGEPVPYGLTTEDALAFIENEQALLAKKNTGEKKPTAKQKENEGYKDEILAFLMSNSEGQTASAVLKGVPSLSEYNVQKAAALLGALVKEGRVVKNMVKGKALFSVA